MGIVIPEAAGSKSIGAVFMWNHEFIVKRTDPRNVEQELANFCKKRLHPDRIELLFWANGFVLLEEYKEEKGKKERVRVKAWLDSSGDPQTIISVKINDRLVNRIVPELNYDRGYPQGELINIFKEFEGQPGAKPEPPEDEPDIPIEIKTFHGTKTVKIPSTWKGINVSKKGQTKKKVLAYYLDSEGDWSQSEVASFTSTSTGNIKKHKRELKIDNWR